MNYSIKPYISCDDIQLSTFFTEINALTLIELNDGLENFEVAIKGSVLDFYWGLHVSEMNIGADFTDLEYQGTLVRKFPTHELYNLLDTYRKAMMDYEIKYNS